MEDQDMKLTILDGIPQRGSVFLGKAHNLLRIAVSDKIGLCSFWKTGNRQNLVFVIGTRSRSPHKTAKALYINLLKQARGRIGQREKRTYLFDAVEKSISDVPLITVSDLQSPGECGLIQVHQQADWEVSKLDFFVVETAAGHPKEG